MHSVWERLYVFKVCYLPSITCLPFNCLQAIQQKEMITPLLWKWKSGPFPTARENAVTWHCKFKNAYTCTCPNKVHPPVYTVAVRLCQGVTWYCEFSLCFSRPILANQGADLQTCRPEDLISWTVLDHKALQQQSKTFRQLTSVQIVYRT